MLKSFLIKLRRKPKVVREHTAMMIAAIFTFLVFGVWAFSLPGQFSGLTNTETTEIFSSLKEDIKNDVPDFTDISEDYKQIVATTSEEVNPVIIPNEYPTSSTTSTTNNSIPIRLATTSKASSTVDENSQ